MPTKQLNQSELNRALLSAAENGETSKIKKLISNGADVNAKNNNDWTALHQASYNCHIKIAKLLIEHGADINAKDNYGQTPLHNASWNGHTETIQLLIKTLIKNGADIHAKDKEGCTAEDIARRFGCENIAELLKCASERQKELKKIDEQLEHQKRIQDTLRRKDLLTISNGEFIDLLESEMQYKK